VSHRSLHDCGPAPLVRVAGKAAPRPVLLRAGRAPRSEQGQGISVLADRNLVGDLQGFFSLDSVTPFDRSLAALKRVVGSLSKPNAPALVIRLPKRTV
jgi:hypothetical protein